MSRPARPVRWLDVERELARAQGSRRLLPWAVASAAFVGLLVGIAGAGWRGGLVIGALGLLFAAFAAVTSVPRCPACGASLARLRGERAAAAGFTRDRRCPRCHVPYE